ncbi:MAG: hypothetical protein NTZ60_02325 [Campylobacterales bacterium]|nr:hypothetical protein [Campylobacterales bacterium]
MKIENFALDLHAESFKSSSVSIVSFERELDSQNVKRLEEVEALNSQVEFCKRLEFELVQQLLSMLNSKTCRFKELSTEQFKANQSREVTIMKEYKESQSLDVSMSGFIQIANKKIELNIDISMSHSFVSSNQILHQQFYDPLVLNFNGKLPDLDTQNFSFDIDCDGACEQISMLKNGSGFLALDKNENNRIDDGSELFGALNGNAFADLKRYDSDKNGWIDESDPILDKLKIWIKNKDENRLVALGELGIGAIYLGKSEGQFDIKSDTNETLGRIRDTGFFLKEDGTSGIMSQIDFARQNGEVNKISDISLLNEVLKIV